MMALKKISGKCTMATAAWGAVALLGLCSCGEEEKVEAPVVTEAAQQQAAPEEKPEVTELSKFDASRDALMDYVLHEIAAKVTDPVEYPMVNSQVKDMLVLLEEYYAALQHETDMPAEKARIAVLIATTRNQLGAWARAHEEYNQALKDIEALSEDARKDPEFRRAVSTIQSGIASCLLMQGKASEALGYYEQSLKTDEEIFASLGLPAGQPLPKGTNDPRITEAVVNLLGSYRCLGDCQNLLDDPEEAKETYRKGEEFIQGLNVLTPEMGVAFVKLLSVSGALEQQMGNEKGAYGKWYAAVSTCQTLYKINNRAIQASAQKYFNQLVGPYTALARKLAAAQKAEAEAAAKAAAQTEVTSEPIQEVPVAAETPAEPEKAAEEKAEPKNEPAPRRQRRRRR